MKISEIKGNNYTDYTVVNDGGLSITLRTLGASIHDIIVPDKFGTPRRVTLTPESDDIFAVKHYGKTCGRTAGRIENARFEIDGRTAVLEANNHGRDNLHGGKTGLHTADFAAQVKKCDDYCDIEFTYSSPDGEGGYFGSVTVGVTYRVYNKVNKFKVIYNATTDAKTLLNLTNHVYLNASGDLRQSTTEQELYINASNYGLLNDRLIIRKIVPVTKQMDFTTAHKIGDWVEDEEVQRYTNGYDHPYKLNARGTDNIAAYLKSELSGIKVSISTTYPFVVFYGNSCPVEGMKLVGGKSDAKYMAACLECQYHPDGVHACPDDCGIFTPQKPYNEEIVYEFTVEK